MRQARALSALSLFSVVVALSGCPGPTTDTPDAAPSDGGRTDGAVDSGRTDSGRTDSGPVDGGVDANVDAAVARCGDGVVNGGDSCDDGNTTAGDGCSDTCTTETGWNCDGASPTVCTAVCGDGTRVGDEAGTNGCDDANTIGGDGCSASCTVEPGFSCAGAPSVCMTGCGDGIVAGTEQCDDHNLTDADGCSMSCAIEPGWSCSGAPLSTCTSSCGDGVVAMGAETCDDGNTADLDGCSSSCAVEAGWDCSTGACLPICGDGMTLGLEGCDDGNTVTEACAYGQTSCSVCDATCALVPGLTSFCGDTITDAANAEVCDDGNTVDETACAYGTPTCTTCDATCANVLTLTGSFCGDGVLDATEGCDDGNTLPFDGCSDTCAIENGYQCSGAPSVCNTVCGDSIIAGTETCDDGNAITDVCPYGGPCTVCTASCQLGAGGVEVCGDGIVNGPETCDDGYLAPGDGCSGACAIEAGFTCAGTPSRCSFTTSYTGAPVAVPDNNAAGATLSLTVGQPACVVSDVSTTHRWEPNHTWAGDITLTVVAPGGATSTLLARPGVSGVGAGISSDLDGPYTFAAGGAAFPTTAAAGGAVVAAGTYNADYTAVIGAHAAGVWGLRAVDAGVLDTGSLAEFSITITCDPRPPVRILADCFDGAGEVDFHRGTVCRNAPAGASAVASYSDFPYSGVVSVTYFAGANCTGTSTTSPAEVNFCFTNYADGTGMNDRLGSYRISY